MFGFALYTGMQATKYMLSNRLQEVGVFLSILLFFFGAIASAFLVTDKNLKWSWWFFATIVFISYFMIVPGYVFHYHTGASALASIAASREFLAVIIGPALWFLYRSGIDIELIERVICITFALALVSYIFHYFRMDLVAAYNSTDNTVSSLVTFDPWRGYRLSTPGGALLFGTLVFPALLFKEKVKSYRYIWLVTVLVLVFIWSLTLARAAAATLIAATIAYHVAFAKKSRLGVLFTLLPVIIPASIIGFTSFISHLGSITEVNGDSVRFISYNIAWDNLKLSPIVGLGQDSNATITFREIYFKYFFPTDIGLAGVAFKYGAVGLLLYLFFSFYILVRLVKTNWLHRKKYGASNLILVGLIILFISFIMNMVLSPALIQITGLVIASLSVSLTAIWKHKISNE